MAFTGKTQNHLGAVELDRSIQEPRQILNVHETPTVDVDNSG